MKKKAYLKTKLIFVFVFIYLISTISISIINNLIASDAFKNRLFEFEIPATIESIIAEVNNRITNTDSGISKIAGDEFLQEWILNGEPEEDIPKIIKKLKLNTKSFNTIGSNLSLLDSQNYYTYRDGKYEFLKLQETDLWFTDFEESGVPSNINLYHDHELYGAVAFINVRIDRNGVFLGIISVSLSLKDFIDAISNKKIGKNGNTFMINKSGIVTLHEDEQMIGKLSYLKEKGYSNNFKEIMSNDTYTFQYKNNDKDNIFVNSVYIPELDWFLIVEASQKELFKQIDNAVLVSIILVVILTSIGIFIFTHYINNLNKSKLQLILNQKEMEKIILKKTSKLKNSLEVLQDTKDKLIESERMAVLGQLVMGVAHELNTPIGICITASTYLEEISADFILNVSSGKLTKKALEIYSDKVAEASDVILKSLSKGSKLINTFKGIDVCSDVENKKNFNLNELFLELMVAVHSRADCQNIKVIVDCPSDLIIYSYPDHLYKVMATLVGNSIEHAFDNIDSRTISISVVNEDSTLKIFYKDSGIGIGENQLAKVFDPFFTTKRGEGHSGLGLSIIYNIITHLFKGYINCQNKHGACFEIGFPICN